MNTPISRWCFWCATVAVGLNALAISPTQVQQKLSAGERITFIDVRAQALFEKGHIPNALNIPVGLVPQKTLPPLGHVVVYDDGLGRNDAETAAVALNRKPGVTAEVLNGGLAAWESAQAPTTKARGMKPEELPLITYAKLKETQSADVVLVDLRAGSTRTAKSALSASTAPLTDLRAEFPNARITHSPFAVPSPTQAASTGPATPPLLVLIDSGDGAAREMARTLRANGIRRFVILAGGEEILARQGQPGLQRRGASVTLQQPILAK